MTLNNTLAIIERRIDFCLSVGVTLRELFDDFRSTRYADGFMVDPDDDFVTYENFQTVFTLKSSDHNGDEESLSLDVFADGRVRILLDSDGLSDTVDVDVTIYQDANEAAAAVLTTVIGRSKEGRIVDALLKYTKEKIGFNIGMSRSASPDFNRP